MNEADWNDDHDYAMETSATSKRKDSAPLTPSKIPVGKKRNLLLISVKYWPYTINQPRQFVISR